jgi:hypothetical protein
MSDPVSVNVGANVSVVGAPLEKLVDTVGYLLQSAVQPFTSLAQSVSSGVGAVVTAYSQEVSADIHDRAERRRRVELCREQNNLELVIAGAARMLPAKVSDEPVSEDWVAQFAEHVKRVSDDDMRALWSKILAGELTTPGSFTKRTLQTVKNLERGELERFRMLCSFVVSTPERAPWLPFRTEGKPIFKAMEAVGIDYGTYIDLTDAGLLVADTDLVLLPEVRKAEDGSFAFDLVCGTSKLVVYGGDRPRLPIRGLSAAGAEIAHLAEAQPSEAYLKELKVALEELLLARVSLA